tara:strand:+ start:21124 stop:22236 length:1113 start_codon:yes stop_codon:yes gene_type:complete
MKTRQFIILILFLGVLALIYFPIVSEKEVKKDNNIKQEQNFVPIYDAKNSQRVQQLDSYGQIVGLAQFDVTMKVQGEIDRDNRLLKTGMTFKKNEILVKVDRTEALYNLLSRRSQFINLISGVIPDISIDLPDEEDKWKRYLAMIMPTAPLPELPEIKSQKEKLLINGRNIMAEYYGIKSAESQIEEYFYVAPFNGVIVESFVEPGSMISPGMRLFTIAENDEFEVKAPISIDDIANYESAENVFFTSSKEDTIGFGKLLRTSPKINTQTQSVDAYFSLNGAAKPVIGSFVNVSVISEVKDSSVVLPEITAQNGRVQILKDSLIMEKSITILGTKPDSVFVSGINDGEKVILQPVESYTDSTKFIGIIRN